MERIGSERPDVVFLDWLMPLMDGGEVLDRLGLDAGSSIPIIVISGQPAPGVGLDPRIQSWLTKPVTVEQLVLEIQRHQPVQQLG